MVLSRVRETGGILMSLPAVRSKIDDSSWLPFLFTLYGRCSTSIRREKEENAKTMFCGVPHLASLIGQAAYAEVLATTIQHMFHPYETGKPQ